MKAKAIVTISILSLLLVSGLACGGGGAPPADSDGDGWTDAQEQSAGTDPYSVDTDGDGQWDPYDPDPLDPNIPATPTPMPTPTQEPTPGRTPTKCEIDRDAIQVALDAYHVEKGNWPTDDGGPGAIEWDNLVPDFLVEIPSTDSKCDWQVNSDPEGEVCLWEQC